MAVATVTSKGQVTIPKAVREAMGLGPGDRVRFVRREDGIVVVEPVTVDVRTLKRRYQHRGTRRRSLEEMDEAIASGAAKVP